MTTINLTNYNALVDDDGSNTTGTLATKAAILLNPILTPVQTAITALDAADALKAPLASPTFTGVPAAPTAAVLTDTTQIATTAYVQANVAQLRASANNSAVQAVVTATFTAILFDTEAYDTGALHDTVTNKSRFTVPTGAGGLWLITGMLTWAGSAAGTQRQGLIYKNGAAVVTNVVAPSSTYEPQNVVAAQLTLVATDYIELYGYQDSGGNLNTVAAKTLLACVRLGK